MTKLNCETVREIQKAVREELALAPKFVRLEWVVGVLAFALAFMIALNILTVLG